MTLTNHTTITNLDQLKIGEKRNILFNGLIYLAKICEIIPNNSVIVEIRYYNSDFKVAIPMNFIYDERPHCE